MAPSRQRTAVQEALAALDHPSADEVFQHVREQVPRISLATVYRNLDTLVQEGEAGIRHIGGQRRYDANTDQHLHLHCTECDRLADVPADPRVERSLASKASDAGYDFEDSLVEIRGVCPRCRQRPRTKHRKEEHA